jgi:predicted secreted hydrolase
VPTTLQNSIELPDLSERRDAPIEWWFIQGSARKESGEALHFMAAFFQVHLPGNGHAPAQMLLVHVLNGDGAPGHTASRITPAMITAHEAIARELSRTNFAFPLSHVAFRRHMADTLRFAETNGIRTFETPASLGNAPFSIEWDEFLFTEDAGALSLRLPLNGSGETAELRLEPQRPGWTRKAPGSNRSSPRPIAISVVRASTWPDGGATRN